MFESLHDAMTAHALEAWPEPACGAVVGSGEAANYVPARVVAEGSRAAFRVDVAAVRRLEDRHGPARALVLSHPSVDEGVERIDPLLFTPSASEMVAQASLAVPFGVVVCDRSRACEPWWFGDQCPIPKLVGRPFRHGVTDCYSIIRDWFRLERSILMPDFPRDWNWWSEGMDLYRHGFAKAGGRNIDPEEIRPGDVILFRMRSRVPNHAGLVLDHGWLLHHFAAFKPYEPERISHIQRPMRWHNTLATHWLRYGED